MTMKRLTLIHVFAAVAIVALLVVAQASGIGADIAIAALTVVGAILSWIR